MSTSTPSHAVSKGERRQLRFDTIDQAVADADQLASAEEGGKLVQIGNWTLGQALGHIAAWVDYGYNGVPLKPPIFVKWIARLLKKRILNHPMKAGRSIPGVPNGTLATDLLTTVEGLSRFHRSMNRLKIEPPGRAHVLFGPMEHEEWIKLNLRHAELHLSFFRVG